MVSELVVDSDFFMKPLDCKKGVEIFNFDQIRFAGDCHRRPFGKPADGLCAAHLRLRHHLRYAPVHSVRVLGSTVWDGSTHPLALLGELLPLDVDVFWVELSGIE